MTNDTLIHPSQEKNERLLTATAVFLALIYFFVPAGRFHASILGISFTTGYDAFKLIPFPVLTWLLWRKTMKTRPKPNSTLLIPFLSLFLFTLISGMASPNGWQALADSLEFLFYLGLLLLLLDFPWTPRLIQIVATGFVIGNLYLGSVVLQQFLATRHAQEIVRLSGTFTHPNILGAYAILGFTLLLWLMRYIHNKIYFLWTGIATVSIFFALLMTQSRTALLALAVWGLTAMWLGTPKIRKLTGLLLVVAVAIILFIAPQILTRIHALGEEIPDPSRINRPMIWQGYLTSEIPTLSPFGIGMGPVSTYRFGDWIASSPERPILSRAWGPHNSYLAWLLGTGLLGLFLFIWLLKTAWDRIQQGDAYSRAILAAGLLSFIATCFFQDPLLQSNIPIAWLTLLAIGDRMATIHESEEAL